jgi:hypothetical protein
MRTTWLRRLIIVASLLGAVAGATAAVASVQEYDWNMPTHSAVVGP